MKSRMSMISLLAHPSSLHVKTRCEVLVFVLAHILFTRCNGKEFCGRVGFYRHILREFGGNGFTLRVLIFNVEILLCFYRRFLLPKLCLNTLLNDCWIFWLSSSSKLEIWVHVAIFQKVDQFIPNADFSYLNPSILHDCICLWKSDRLFYRSNCLTLSWGGGYFTIASKCNGHKAWSS